MPKKKIENSDESTRAAFAEYINKTVHPSKRNKEYTAEDIAKNTDNVAWQIAVLDYVNGIADIDAAIAFEDAAQTKIVGEQKGAFGAEDKHSFEGYAEDGKGMYKSNFPKGTPKTAKSKVILDYIQNVWSKNPITLKINENGQTRDIVAHFDPTYSEDTRFKSDASKLMGGNRHGTASDQRVTLDLADDYYQIASEAEYNYSKDETGKDTPTHEGVRKWHYFVNDIYFSEFDSDDYRPYRVTINVKEKSDGNFVYSFSAEAQEGSSTPQTLHAVVSDDKVTANAQPSNPIIHQNEPVVNTESEKNVDKHDLADKPVKTAQEGAEKSVKAVESKNTQKSADAKDNGETAKKNNPSVSDADSSLYTREPAQKEALTDEQRRVRARERVQKWIEWEQKTAPTVKELNTAREAVKGFDNLPQATKAAVIRMIRSADGKVDSNTIKGIANLMTLRRRNGSLVMPDLELRFAEGIGDRGLYTHIGEGENKKTLILINTKADSKAAMQGTIAHEIVHYIENRKGYGELAEYVKGLAKEDEITEIQQTYNEHYKGLYTAEERENGLSGDTLTKKVAERMATEEYKALVESEVVASLIGKRLTNEKFLKKYATKDDAMIKKIFRFLKASVSYLKDKDKAASDEVTKLVNKFSEVIGEEAVGESASGVKYSAAGAENEEVNSIKEQLKKSNDKLASMTPIKSKEPPRTFKNAKEALEWAVEVLKSSGELIQRKGYGEVVLDEKRLKNGLSYLKTDMEKVAFSLVPKVIKNGIEIGRHPKHKERTYDTVTFASPVTVGDTTGYMAVVIREEGKNYFKLHRVFMPDGSLFEFQKTKRSNAETAGLRDANLSPTNVTSNNSIPQKSDLSTGSEEKVVAKRDLAPKKKAAESDKKVEKLEEKNKELEQKVKKERSMREKLARENAQAAKAAKASQKIAANQKAV